MRVIKVIGMIVLALTTIVIALYFYIKYKSENIEDKKNLEASINEQAGKFLQDG
jgi:hypothetical protein